MKPQLLNVPTGSAHSFSVRQDWLPNINNRWHHHTEVELVHFHRGGGTQFVGDSIKRFSPGDIVLVGRELPHYWYFDKPIPPDAAADGPYATVIHFTEDFWGDRFLNLPENKPLRTMLDKSRRGLLLPGDLAGSVAVQMDALRQAEGPRRIMGLMECLYAIARSPAVTVLSSAGFRYDRSESESERINAIYDYTLRRFARRITLTEVAGVAGLVPNSFCRYFKGRTGKTYVRFLTEIRVGHACKQLIDNQLDIKRICYESGFNNSTCFHQQFKAVMGKTPQQYQQAYVAQ
jgi:AraC-like DNA-binding protein